MYLECESAVDYLIDFWISVATDRPSGELNGLDNLDLALMAGWNGDPDEFVGAMIKAGFIDRTVRYRREDLEEYFKSSVVDPEQK